MLVPVHLRRLLPLRRGLRRRSSPDVERFAGTLVHPQFWPEDLDYAGKRVVVVGSGATAVTLVPALAERRRARDDAAALADATSSRSRPRTRSPTACDGCSATAARTRSRAGRTSRSATLVYQLSQRFPRMMRGAVPRAASMRALPPGYDVDTHFNPRYGPWDQRLCLVPDGDLFKALSARAGVDGHRPDRALHAGRASGSPPARELEADIVVTATGLNLLALGGVELVGRRRAGRRCPSGSRTRA